MRKIMPFLAVAVIGAIILWLGSLLSDVPGQFQREPGSVYNTNEEGAAALERWLTALNYDVRRMEYVEWAFDEKQQAVLIIQPSSFFEAGDPQTILDWVNDTGGTLIVIDNKDNSLLRELDISMSEEPVSAVADSQQPLANPAASAISNPETPFLSTTRPDAAVLIGSEEQPLGLAVTEGRGMVYVFSSPEVATNLGLRDERNARLMQNLLSRVPEGGTVVFDEIHHGRALPPKRPRAPVVFSPLVAALIYGAIVIGLWGFLNGRRFGSIVPTRMEASRRSSAEYVQSMASLFQRGRQTGHILNHYKTVFKRRLAKPYGFNPRIADADYVRELNRFIPIDQARLGALLNALSTPNPSEEALLRIINAADGFAAWFEHQR